MPSIIKVDEGAINTLRNALETAGQEYKSNLARLTALIEEITSGDITGDPATDLLTKYQTKEAQFRNITRTIEEAEEYMGVKGTKFSNMIGELKSGMR